MSTVLPAACNQTGAGRPEIHFDTATAQIKSGTKTYSLVVEIAENEDQRAVGLMGRRSLDENAGMLFLYPEMQDAGRGFWMYRTPIALDIVFMDEAGRIVGGMEMEPCTSEDPGRCPTYHPGVPYRSALEVNRGYFSRRNIQIGARVILDIASWTSSRLPNALNRK